MVNHHQCSSGRERSVVTSSMLQFFLSLSVAVSKLQVTILARSSREMSQTVRIESTSSHEFAFQFGIEMFLYAKNTKNNYRENRLSRKSLLNETASGRKGAVLTPNTVDRSPAKSGNGNGHSGDRLSQTDDKQQVKTATARVYTFTA